MISVNQEIGTSVPEKVEKGGARNVSYQGGPLNDGGRGGGVEIFNGAWHSGGH